MLVVRDWRIEELQSTTFYNYKFDRVKSAAKDQSLRFWSSGEPVQAML